MATVSYREYSGTGAENYERNFVPAIAVPVSVDLLEAAQLRPGERVLDVACGTGLIARLAAEQVGPDGSVTGIDLAPDMIEVAKRVAPDIEWHVGDATSLPFPDASYDVVTSQMGLQFVEDRQAAVAEMARVLKPGGRVIINTPGAITDAFTAMEEAIIEHINPELGGFVGAVFSMHDPDVHAGLLRAAGFKDVSARVSTARLRLPDPATFLWQYINLTPMGPLVAQAPEDAKSAMEKKVVEAWAPFVQNGSTVFDQPNVIATGRR